MAQDADFGGTLNRNLMIQLISGCADQKVQQDLLASLDITLDRVIAIMTAAETAKRDSGGFFLQQMHSTDESMHKVGQGRFLPTGRGRGVRLGHPSVLPPHIAPVACFACGSLDHVTRSLECPALGRTCNHCAIQGHFEAVCQQKEAGLPKAARGSIKRINVVDVTAPPATDDAIMVRIYVQDGNQQLVPITVEVDTGAQPTTITMATYKRHFSGLKLQSIFTPLTGYDGSDLHGIHGFVITTIYFEGRSHIGLIYVVDNDIPAVLGRNFLIPLQVRIDCASGAIFSVKGLVTPADTTVRFTDLAHGASFLEGGKSSGCFHGPMKPPDLGPHKTKPPESMEDVGHKMSPPHVLDRYGCVP